MLPVFRTALSGASRRLVIEARPLSRSGFRLLSENLSASSLAAGRNGPGKSRSFHFSRTLSNTLKKEGKSVVEKTVKAAEETGPKKRPSLKELTKKYGWAAVGVYFGLSAIDFPLCFLFVHSMGKEKVQELEKSVKGFFGFSTKPDDLSIVPDENAEDLGTESTEEENNWSLLITELTIAYAIHKSVFIFVRVPTTAAITPWVVKKLRSWGFNIGGKAAETTARFGTAPSNRQKWTSWFS
ncbi:Nat2p [Sugiyamaella lignohabitans]|uniref:Nat2p n=1 Tax=Sugiyamaella lignohabitans TaxID=796027 RepID=A0A161HHF4_9ASCO|nr:Nat2p [Sugiyamaella lignohabitans]ANB11567.1 Nat2p [Sugiyamaella lignohabitans]